MRSRSDAPARPAPLLLLPGQAASHLGSFAVFLSPPTSAETPVQAPQLGVASSPSGCEPWCGAATAEDSEPQPGLKQAVPEAEAMAIATSAQLARALYDNTAESPQELSFRRGDVLRVLQREGAGGLDGWCLCSLHGQQGIVPANRVKLLPASPAPKPSLSVAPPTQPGSPHPALERDCEEQEVYVIPPPARPCPATGPLSGSCPPSPDPIYKVPRGNGTQPGDALEVYDVPSAALRTPSSDPYDSPASFSRLLAQVAPQPPGEGDSTYDVPLAPKLPTELEPDLEWEGGREPGPPLYAAPSNLKRASALLNLYEAPEELTNGEAGDTDEGIYDVPLLGPEAPPSPEPPGASASSDLDTLAGLLPRSPPPPHRPRLPSAESLSRRPLPALPVPEAPSPSPTPSPAPGRKGSIQDRPLPPTPPRLPGYGSLKAEGNPESREVEDDPAGPHNEYEGIPMAEEYDYVHLKGMDKAQESRPLDKAFPEDPGLLERGLPEQQEALSPGEPLILSTGDQQLLHFYAGQCQSHYSALQAAVATLMSSTQANQPPRLFVPHGKRVVVTAHRLVFVGDTLGRLASSAPLRVQVGAASTALGQALQATVLAVKGAALGYPSGPAIQQMARCVAELSGQALQFTTLLTSLAP